MSFRQDRQNQQNRDHLVPGPFNVRATSAASF